MFLLNRKVPRLRVVEDQRAHRSLRLHHVTIGELDPDLLGMYEPPELDLVFKRRTGRVAERIALAPISSLQPRPHLQIGGIGESPKAAQLGVEPFGGGLRRLKRQRLNTVALQEFPLFLEPLVRLSDPVAGGHGEKAD